jgi:hypothetical protein
LYEVSSTDRHDEANSLFTSSTKNALKVPHPTDTAYKYIRRFYEFQSNKRFFPSTKLSDGILERRWSVFTVRYELNLVNLVLRFESKCHTHWFHVS